MRDKPRAGARVASNTFYVVSSVPTRVGTPSRQK